MSLQLISLEIHLGFAKNDKRLDLSRNPDGSVHAMCKGLPYQKEPFLIIEVGYTQTADDLLTKVQEYADGAHGRIRTIVVVKIYPAIQCKTQMQIYKVQRVSCPKDDRLDGFESIRDQIEEIEIYPSPTDTGPVLRFTLQDLFPGYEGNDREPIIRIDLTSAIAGMRDIIDLHRQGAFDNKCPSSWPNTPNSSNEEISEKDYFSNDESQNMDEVSEYTESNRSSSEHSRA